MNYIAPQAAHRFERRRRRQLRISLTVAVLIVAWGGAYAPLWAWLP